LQEADYYTGQIKPGSSAAAAFNPEQIASWWIPETFVLVEGSSRIRPKTSAVAIPLLKEGSPKIELNDPQGEVSLIDWNIGSVVYLAGNSSLKSDGYGKVPFMFGLFKTAWMIILEMMSLRRHKFMQSHENRSQSLHRTPTPASPAATATQELLAALDGQSGILAATSMMKSTLDDPEGFLQLAVADNKQEWEICDIVSKGDIDGVPHYWVQWSVTLLPKFEMGKARALVARFEAGLRAQGKQKCGKGRGKLPPLKPGKRAIAGVRTKGETQKKRGRGRPRK
jgi:hypothetical protein